MISVKSLQHTIKYVNAGRQNFLEEKGWLPGGATSEAEHVIELLFHPCKILAVYGSLMPGRENHHLLDGVAGCWSPGIVKGHYQDNGWAEGVGYPSVVWDPEGDEIPVQVLVSDELPAHWGRLDSFEGEAYRRILAPVYEGNRVRWVANIYESAIKCDG